MSNKRPPPQAKIPNFAEQFFSLPVADISSVQQTALNLWQLGLNVFPLPYGAKGGFSWSMMQYTRLLSDDLYPLFRDNCNIAVMTGRTSSNLFVIDCETKAAFEYHEKLLKKADIPIWSVRSMGVRSGGHFYLRSRDGEIKNVRAGERRDVEIRGNRCYVLCPPSLHPETRRIYEWGEREIAEPPVVSLEQVLFLGLSVTSGNRQEKMPQSFSELSAQTRDFLLHGATEGERNNRLFMAACDLAGNEYSIHTAMQLLLPVTFKIFTPDKEARATIASAYSRPRNPAKPQTLPRKKETAYMRAIAWAESHIWRGKSGQTDKAVFIACCKRAEMATDAHGIFRAGCREIAEIARVTRTTAAASLKRLEAAKFLIFAGKDQVSKTHLYRLPVVTTSGNLLRNRDTTAYTNGHINVTVPQQSSDASEWKALGKTAYSLYGFLTAQNVPVKQTEISKLTTLSKYQVSRGLKKLIETKLVIKNGHFYHAIQRTVAELDELVALPAGTLGKGQLRHVQHERERAIRAADTLYKARFGKSYHRPKLATPRSGSTAHICSNCGQVWYMPELEPPEVCSFCGDITTWKPIPQR